LTSKLNWTAYHAYQQRQLFFHVFTHEITFMPCWNGLPSCASWHRLHWPSNGSHQSV